MKKALTVTLSLFTMLLLTAVAHADVVFNPVEVAGYSIMQYLPWILVGAVAGITVFLLQKFWKKKK